MVTMETGGVAMETGGISKLLLYIEHVPHSVTVYTI